MHGGIYLVVDNDPRLSTQGVPQAPGTISKISGQPPRQDIAIMNIGHMPLNY